MAFNLLEKIMNIFFTTNATVLGVVDEEKGHLIGIIYKSKLVRELSDLNIAKSSKEMLSSELMDFPSEEDILPILETNLRIPIINRKGELLSSWGKVEMLKAFEKIPVPLIQEFKPERIKKSEEEDLSWFVDLILKNIQSPLFATDLQGKTLFYNQPFEMQILKGNSFRNISSCENYFIRENRKMVSKALEQGLDLNQAIKSSEVIGNFSYDMMSLEYLSKTKGYLYEFHPLSEAVAEGTNLETARSKQDSSKAKKHSPTKSSLEEDKFTPSYIPGSNTDEELSSYLFEGSSNHNLLSLLDAYEKKIIELTLKHFQNNISHTATFLAVPRQTLQYHINKLFRENPVKTDSFIPRGRKLIQNKIKNKQYQDVEIAIEEINEQATVKKPSRRKPLKSEKLLPKKKTASSKKTKAKKSNSKNNPKQTPRKKAKKKSSKK